MPRSDGLILHCPFWGDAGDVSGVGVNGADTGTTYGYELVGGVWRPTAQYGGDGDETNYPGLHFGPVMTAAAWCRFEAVGIKMIWGEYSNPGNTWLFYFYTSGAEQRISLWDGSDSYAVWTPTLGQWYHVAVTNSASACQVYIDGSALTMAVGTGQTWSSTANDFHVAKTTAPYHWSGAIADLRCYNRALSAAEILNLYQRRYPLAA
jgi:hypothetical protein